MLLFWEQGYSGTSFKALQSAMAIPHPQSLIAAFGSKPGLFEAALNAYWERRLGPVLARLDADESVEAFEGLLDGAARLYTTSSPARGCLILTGLVNLRPDDAAVSSIVTAYRWRIFDAIERRLARAVTDKHLSPMLKPSLNELCLTTLCGMALRAQSGASHDDLVGGIDLVLEPLNASI